MFNCIGVALVFILSLVLPVLSAWEKTVAAEGLGEIIIIPDENLEKAIRNTLNKPIGDITASDIEALTSLNARDCNISDLTGLEYAANLDWLDLSHNRINNLLPLSGLTKLEMLWLSSNQISDLIPLADLTTIERLYLGNNEVSDLSPLLNLTNLKRLNLSHNQVSDLLPLSGLTKLEMLDLRSNKINVLLPLSVLTQLEWLYLFNNQISDLSPLSDLTNLLPLSDLSNLKRVYLNYNYIDITVGSQTMEIIQNLINNGAEVFYEHQLGVGDVKYGDVAGEGVISINDAILILRHIVGSTVLNKDQLVRAMVNNGETLTISDAILILRYIVGLITKFPVEKHTG